jgi:hypothetical protein
MNELSKNFFDCYEERIATILEKERNAICITTEGDLYHDANFNECEITLEIGDDFIFSFTLCDMIGCCGILIYTLAKVTEYPKDVRNRGLGTLMSEMAIDIAKTLGYGILIATDVTCSNIQQKIFIKQGWQERIKFVNPRTDNEVVMWEYYLDNEYEPEEEEEYYEDDEDDQVEEEEEDN